ncbi:MAG: metallophosphoesterase [Hymenobacter sp.]
MPAALPPPPRPRKRRLAVAVVSDVHLGTYGCHAPELLRYLKSIKPKLLVLNGDIVDIWQFPRTTGRLRTCGWCATWPAWRLRALLFTT